VRQRWPELVRARSAPKRRGGVRGERGVVRGDREAFLERLRDEKPVERIAVVGGQRRQTKRVRDRDRQLVESRPAGGAGDRGQIGFDLAERRLDGDLPGARRAELDGVTGIPKGCRDSAGKTSRLRQRPEQRVRVEQQPQRAPSKRARISFGSGASKSAATWTLPRRAPSLRGARRCSTGVSLATGFPWRVITTSSPRAALSSRRERWVLAAYTLTFTGPPPFWSD